MFLRVHVCSFYNTSLWYFQYEYINQDDRRLTYLKVDIDYYMLTGLSVQVRWITSQGVVGEELVSRSLVIMASHNFSRNIDQYVIGLIPFVYLTVR